MMSNLKVQIPEYPATVEDFFSDEGDSDSSGDDDDSDQQIVGGVTSSEIIAGAVPGSKKKKRNAGHHGASLPSVDLTKNEFRKRGKELIDFIADYMEGTRERAVSHNIIPGFLFRKMSPTAPKEAGNFDSLMDDLQKFILPGVPQWMNPGHHAMLPLGASYASVLGGMLCDGLGASSLTWNECPAAVELEMVVLNWIAELMDLPLDFHFFGKGAATGKRQKPGHGGAIKTESQTGSANDDDGLNTTPQPVDGVVHVSASSRASNLNTTLNNNVAGFQPHRHSHGRVSVGAGNYAPNFGVGGGGIILSSTTECLLTVLAAAKRRILEHLKEIAPNANEWELMDKFMAYCSEQSHPGMERVCEIIGVKLKRLWTDRQGIMHCNILKSVLEKDKVNGFTPFVVVATAGTIASASVDQIDRIGPLLEEQFPHLWFHVDASYAGSAFICREYQPLLHGIGYADSINVTVHKWLPIHMDCACLWVKKILNLTFTFGCEDPQGPLTIPSDDKNMMAEFRHWSLPMMRRFKAIKIWTVFKLYGFKKLQQKIREDVRRAKELERIMQDDHRFEIIADTMFGVVTFRCKRPDRNDINKEILHQINKSLIIKMSGAWVGNKFWLRFVVAGRYTTSEDVLFSWEMIKRATSDVTAEDTERSHNEGRCGMPNYKHVVIIGKEERLDDKDPNK